MTHEKLVYLIREAHGATVVAVPIRGGEDELIPLGDWDTIPQDEYLIAGTYDPRLPTFSATRVRLDLRCAYRDAVAHRKTLCYPAFGQVET